MRRNNRLQWVGLGRMRPPGFEPRDSLAAWIGSGAVNQASLIILVLRCVVGADLSDSGGR